MQTQHSKSKYHKRFLAPCSSISLIRGVHPHAGGPTQLCVGAARRGVRAAFLWCDRALWQGLRLYSVHSIQCVLYNCMHCKCTYVSAAVAVILPLQRDSGIYRRGEGVNQRETLASLQYRITATSHRSPHLDSGLGSATGEPFWYLVKHTSLWPRPSTWGVCSSVLRALRSVFAATEMYWVYVRPAFLQADMM